MTSSESPGAEGLPHSVFPAVWVEVGMVVFLLGGIQVRKRRPSHILQCSLESWKTDVNLPVVFTQLSISPVLSLFFFPPEIGTEADEHVHCLGNYHVEE